MPETITIVFTMGRVGSSSVYAALEPEVPNLFHIHYLAPATLAKFRAHPGPLSRNAQASVKVAALMESGAPVRVVTLVRDAIERDLSAAFTAWRSATPEADWAATLADAGRMTAFWSSFYAGVPLRWFDEQMLPGLGVDVYGHPFPIAAGATRFEDSGRDVLVMRSDLDDAAKGAALEDLVGRHVTVGTENTNRESKVDAVRLAYQPFKATMPLTEETVRSVGTSRYMRHFFDTDEAAYVERWHGLPAS